jgi:hypothetical protein
VAIRTVGTGKTYSTVQAAINAAVSGDTIAIDPGGGTGPNGVYPESLTCPDKGVLGSAITLTSSASAANLPAVGQRTSPAYVAFMPTIQSPGVGAPAVQVEVGANHYTFRHIHFPEVPGGINQIISIGYADSTQQFESDEPTDITIDQCYIHGSATLGQKRAIHTAGKRIVITNNYFADIKSTGAGEGDSQCIAGWNGHGPLTVTNNYLSAGTEPFLLGGSDPSIRTYLTVTGSPTTTSATVTCSEASHTLAEIAVGQTIACLVGGVWKQTTLTSKSGNGASGTIGFTALSAAPDVGTNTIKAGCILDGLLFRYNHVKNDPAWINEAWIIKNLLELKACVNAQIDSNIFENHWRGGDDAPAAIWIKTVDQDGTAPYLQTKNIVIEKNIIRHCYGAFELHGIEAENGGRPGPLTNITIRNNLVYDSGTDPWRQGGQTFAFVVTEGVVNCTIDHNTIVHVTTGTAGGALQLDDTVALLSGFVFTNNLVRGETYGIICSGGQGTAGLAAAAPGYVFRKNALSNVSSGDYPTDNQYPSDATWEAQFTAYAVDGVNANFALLPESPYALAGIDHADLGANIGAVLMATATTLTGSPIVEAIGGRRRFRR